MGCINSTVTPVNPNEVDNSHFQVERIIGKGGFGTIHYVIRKGNEEGFARKSQEKHRMVKHSGAVKMAFTEIDTLRLCSSPFICNMQHAYQDDKFVYIVMDLALGGDLDFQRNYRFKSKTIPENVTLFCIAEMYLALRYLHSINVLHRDIKPANMIMQADGHVKLTDFGISVTLSHIDDRIHNGSGTDGYMAPEIYGGTHGVESEWWSFGVCLHELLIGSIPVKTSKGLTKTPCFKVNSASISSAAKDLLPRMLEVNPEARISGEDMKSHAWFQEIDWESLENHTAKPPYVPDTSKANCSTGELDVMSQLGNDSEAEVPSISAKENEKFVLYEYNIAVNADNSNEDGSKSNEVRSAEK